MPLHECAQRLSDVQTHYVSAAGVSLRLFSELRCRWCNFVICDLFTHAKMMDSKQSYFNYFIYDFMEMRSCSQMSLFVDCVCVCVCVCLFVCCVLEKQRDLHKEKHRESV